MNDLIGWLFLTVILFFILVWKRKNKYLANVLLIAFLLRAILIVLQNYGLVIIPDSTGDTVKFNLHAIEFSRNQGLSVMFDFFYNDSFLISRIIGIFYTIFGESKLMALTLSVALGTVSVYLAYRICFEIWDHQSAKKAAWASALFPTLVLYSSLILREVYIVFVLLIALLNIVNFIKKKSMISFLLIIVSFYILSLFHGVMFLGLFVFIFFYFLEFLKKEILNLIYNFKVNIIFLLCISILLISIIAFNNNITIPYVPNNINYFFSQTNAGLYGVAAYPQWLYINGFYDLIPKSIIKILYFLYSPFIWDVKNIYHTLGLLDSFLYFVLTLYLLKNIKKIWSNPTARFFLLILIVYLITHALGVGNFGTGIRHKSKVVIIFIILAVPKINRFIIKKNYLKD